MGRISKIPDTIILDSIALIDSGEISLRARAKELKMAHTSLMTRIKKIRDYWEENNIPINKRYGSYSAKVESGSLKTTTDKQLTTKKDLKTTTYEKASSNKLPYVSLTFLWHMHEHIYGKSDGHKNSREQLLDKFIVELEKQKELTR